MKIGILGYGNLGRGVEAAIKKNEDMELVAVYTRRDPSTLTINTEGVAVKSTADLDTGKEDIDVLIICGGSATDLPAMTPKYAAMFHQQSVRDRGSARRSGVHLLGQGRQSGTLRRGQKNRGRQGLPSVHHPRSRGSRKGAQR